MRKIFIIGATAVLFGACTPSVNVTKTPTSGSVNFSNYMSVGSAYTAGYLDGSLTVYGQLNSYPQRLFEQFALVPPSNGARGPFIQPLLHSDHGYPGPIKVLATTYNACIPDDSSLSPVDFPNFVADPVDDQPYVSGVNNGQINNIAVPFLRVVDMPVVLYAPAHNKYANRFYHDPTKSPMDELSYRVNVYHPTFFTFWMGMDDVLGYALAGGQGDGTGGAAPLLDPYYNIYDISPTAAFEKNYDDALDIMIHTSASGALINIPDITSLPFFNTVPINGLTLTRQGQADSLQALYSVYHAVFQVGSNYFMIRDHIGNIRQAVPGELLLMTTPMDSITCAGWGTTTPIPEKYVLTTDEETFIQNAITTFNGYIKQEANLHHLTYVDMNLYFKSLASGISYDGIKYNTQFVSGGAFSLDGLHPTARGYALIANQVINAVNAFYHSILPTVDANQYHGVNFPNQ